MPTITTTETRQSQIDQIAPQVEAKVQRLRDTFNSGVTLNLAFRRRQLKTMQAMVKAGCDRGIWKKAFWEDLHKSDAEGFLMEVNLILHEIQDHLDHLDEWSKPTKVATDFPANFPGSSYMYPDPLGVVCIIGAWNYPIQLSLVPLVGALSAGNTALIKVPSDKYSKECSKAIATLCKEFFPDEDTVAVIEGDRHATQAVLSHRYDLTFFTGGSTVGRMVAEAAGKNLTPCVLELGGKSPCFVDASADIALAAKRTMWGTFANCGQTCVRPDFLLVHESVADKFLELSVKAVKEMYSENPKESGFFGRIINARAHKRLVNIIETDRKSGDCKVVCGGESDEKDLFVAPTILDFGTDMKAFVDSASMQDELFGPILPLLRYTHLEDALGFCEERCHRGDKSLALYIFANDKSVQNSILKRISAGGVTINDTLMHVGNPNLPFGGIGNSGMGAYHGAHSFKTFTHYKPVLFKTSFLDLPERYPPYTPGNYTKLKYLMGAYPKNRIKMIQLILFILVLAFVVTFLGDGDPMCLLAPIDFIAKQWTSFRNL